METELSNKYQIMPDLGIDEYEELKEDIVARGVMVPIEFDEQGNILDGHHRLRICQELGITNYPKVIRAGMNDSEKRLHARKLNLARRHMTQEQRRGLIREQLSETPEKSDRQIAAGLGVDHKTVGTQRADLLGRGEIPHVSPARSSLHVRLHLASTGNQKISRQQSHASRANRGNSPQVGKFFQDVV
ncbi:MAG: ParB N-terminal domain-containing protein [Synergistaceae bacterium]|nr:ParB N-terminal domain-containing protein [Synergistaceae bacterium]